MKECNSFEVKSTNFSIHASSTSFYAFLLWSIAWFKGIGKEDVVYVSLDRGNWKGACRQECNLKLQFSH